MSFDARASSSAAPSFPSGSSSSPMPHTYFGFSPIAEDSTTAKHIATLQAKLDKKLGPEYISQRPGPGGGPKLTYAEGWKIINLANEVFGFNGWSSSIVNISTDFIDYTEESRRFNVGVSAIVRVTLRDGAYHEDVGYGMLENGKSKAGALDKCKKEAITDALKRTLRNFGNLLGNCLYDKSYAQEVVKIKVPPARFDKNELHRRPEFAERVPDVPAPVPHDQPTVPETPSTKLDPPRIKIEHEGQRPETPITYIPRHLRQEMASATHQAKTQPGVSSHALATPPHGAPTCHTHRSTSGSGSSATETKANRSSPQVSAPKSNGVMTPIQTPAQAQRAPPPRAVATSPLAQTRTEHSVSFAEPLPVTVRAVSADTADQDMDDTDQSHAGCHDEDEDEDEDGFPLSTQDGVFFATVDLGEGDLGRPIDFEEGMGGVSITDESVFEPEVDRMEQSSAISAQPRVDDHAGNGMSAGQSSAGPLKTNARKEAQAQRALNPPSNFSDGDSGASSKFNANTRGVQQQQQSRNGVSNISTSSTPCTRSGSPAQDIKHVRPATNSMGGFHFPPDMQHTHSFKPQVTPNVRTVSDTFQTGSAPQLKRSADVMLAVSAAASSMRPPPIQGMGLAQRQQQQQQNASARRTSDHTEANDPKRLKR